MFRPNDSESSFHNGQNSQTFETSPFLWKVLGSEVLPSVPRNTELPRRHHLPTSKPTREKPLTAKDHFNNRFPNLNLTYYTELTRNLLTKCYPKQCPTCKIPLTKGVSTRENVLRCSQCNCQVSLTKNTPLEHLKIPLWTFSYIFIEALYRSPLGLSSSEIQRRLGVSKNTSLLLKRRLQIFLSDLIPSIKGEMVKEIKKAWKGKILPETGDLGPFIKDKPVLHTDTLALFSASQRANGFRKRFKHSGQTSSIYLSDSVAEAKGKYQIGSLILTQALKGGAVIFNSVPDQQGKTILPFFDYLPKETAIFSDSGFPYLERYFPNSKSINHSARAVDNKRNVWARNRWSKDSVNNQVAEAVQRSLKYSFIASYSYIQPQNSILYLNEYAALKGIKVYGFDCLTSKKVAKLGNVGDRYRFSRNSCRIPLRSKNLLKHRKDLIYKLPSPESRIHRDKSKTRKKIDKQFKNLFEANKNYLIHQAHLDYLDFMESGPKFRKRKEKYYNSVAYMLWKGISLDSPIHQKSYELAGTTSQAPLLRITRRWAQLGIAKVTQVKNKENEAIQYYVEKLIPDLPDILYTFNRDQFLEGVGSLDKIEVLVRERNTGGRSKYGYTMKERIKYLEERNDILKGREKEKERV
ncbi:hypothetical protein V6Z05_18025 [Leptospira venezuelensis]|uniref:hypothetical protein n=1 Tax=Leptospira venezuelensis TaxID=1958811 RepID=UPI001F2EA8F0|nr:hypothetical protein [Leptospira venezuelensis]